MRSQLLVIFSLLKSVISPCPGLYPHPENCHQFYQCDSYQSYLFNCPQGTLFDSALGLCNHEYLVSCSEPSSSSTSRPITQQTSNQPISSTSYVPTVSSTTSSWIPESSSSSGPSSISSTVSSFDNEPINSSVDNGEPSDSEGENVNTPSDSSNGGDELLTSTAVTSPAPSTPSSGGYPTDGEDDFSNEEVTAIGESTSTDEENSSNSAVDGGNEASSVVESASNSEEETSSNEIDPVNSEEDTSTSENGASSGADQSFSNEENEVNSEDTSSSSSSQSNEENEITNEDNEDSNNNSSSSDDTSSSSQDNSDLPQYNVSPTSLYPCVQPGYYSEESSCSEFYVCKEVAPGVLSAEKIFRCPDRYLFDPVTRLCQRQHKVECDTDMVTYYSGFDLLVVKLQEQDLENFFKQELTLPRTRSQIPVFQNIPWYQYPVQLFSPSYIHAYY